MNSRAKAYRIVAAQFGVTAAISAGLLVFSSTRSAWSGLLGGLVAAVASLCSVRLLFPPRGRSAVGFIAALYVGEILKLGLIVASLWVAMALLEAAALPLLITFSATLMVYWLALIPGIINKPH